MIQVGGTEVVGYRLDNDEDGRDGGWIKRTKKRTESG